MENENESLLLCAINPSNGCLAWGERTFDGQCTACGEGHGPGVTLNDSSLSEEAKRLRVTGVLNTVILSDPAIKSANETPSLFDKIDNLLFPCSKAARQKLHCAREYAIMFW